MNTYRIECTDTFGGEANYCWVRRFSVRARSERGAAIVAARHLGCSGRLVDDGAGRRNVRGAAVCFFTEWADGPSDEYPVIN